MEDKTELADVVQETIDALKADIAEVRQRPLLLLHTGMCDNVNHCCALCSWRKAARRAAAAAAQRA